MDRNKIAKRLVDLRGFRKREEVALAVGITAPALAMYETGKRIPKDEVKIRLAKYYRKSVEDIFFAS